MLTPYAALTICRIGMTGVIVFSLASAAPDNAAAQRISIDGTLSPAQTLIGPNYAIGASLGRQVGGNLFQSFGVFGLNQGETATFSGPASVGNVIGRVTGGTASSIDGKIQSTIQGASVYLINPTGVVFGPHATVNVTGGFHASSADYVRTSDGARFQATNPNASTLTAAPPAAFGFLSATPGPVTVNGSTIGPVAGRLALVGGPVTISNGVLLAPAGTVNIASAAGPGEIPVNPTTGPPATVTQYGNVAITTGAKVSVSDPSASGSGSVFVQGGTVSVTNSEIDADNTSAALGGTLSLYGQSAVNITQGATIHANAVASGSGAGINIATGPQGAVQLASASVTASATGSGNAGGISITTGLLAMTSGAQIIDATSGPGAGGPINLLATDTVVSGANTQIGTLAGNGAQITTPSGAGGDISISGSNLTMTQGATIVGETLTGGSAGTINIAMSGAVNLGTTGETANQASAIATLARGSGTGGNIQLTADSLTISGQSGINTFSLDTAVAGSLSVAAREIELNDFASIASNGTSTVALALIDPGVTGLPLSRSGNITVNASDSLTMGGGAEYSRGSVIGVANTSPNPGGDVQVHALNITLTGTSAISSDTTGSGPAGNVTVTADGNLLIERPADLPASAFNPGISSTSNSVYPTAASGNVTVAAHDITIVNGLIDANTSYAGPAGTVKVTAAGTLSITGAPGSDYTSGITADSSSGGPLGTGRAGDVFVQAGAIVLADQGEISSSTFGTGNAGNVAVTANDGLTIVSADTTFLTGIASLANPGSTGNAGTVAVSAGSISMSNAGAEIGTNTSGTGAAGTVNVTTTGLLSISGTSGSSTSSGISAQANAGASGRGGDVFVQAGSISLAKQGDISSSTSGGGDAGNVTVTASGSITINSSGTSFLTGISSQANAGASGNAGAVLVSAGSLSMINADAQITSSTGGSGAAGTVTVTVTGPLSIAGTPDANAFAGINAQARSGSSGRAGNVSVQAGSIVLTDQGEISSSTFGSGAAGNVTVSTNGGLTIDSSDTAYLTGISSLANSGSSGNAGTVRVAAGTISLINAGAEIGSTTSGNGAAGTVNVTAAGLLSITGTPGSPTSAGITAQANRGSSGRAGDVSVQAGSILLTDQGEISSSTAASGDAGNVTVTASGGITINSSDTSFLTGISSQANTGSSGNAGTVVVSAGSISMSNADAQITSSTSGSGAAGTVNVTVTGPLSIAGTPGSSVISGISALANSGSRGNAGDVFVKAGSILLTDQGEISSAAFGSGNAGNVNVSAIGGLTIDSSDTAFLTGITSQAASGSSGNAGTVLVSAGSISISNAGAQISSDTSGSGAAGTVNVTATGLLSISGTPGAPFLAGISAVSNKGLNGRAGDVFVQAGSILITDQGEITSSTLGSGDAGNVTVTASGAITINGTPPSYFTGIGSVADLGSSGNAGTVRVSAGSISLNNTGAEITSSSNGSGSGGSVTVSVAGNLLVDGGGDTTNSTGILARTLNASGGNAGQVVVSAANVTVLDGGQIASTTASKGTGGSVTVDASGAILLDGEGLSETQISASSIGAISGGAGSVIITAGSVTVQGGAQIASTTAGSGPGGDVTVNAGSDISLRGPGQQIATSSSGTGNAGAITISAPRVILSNGAAISTQAQSANGGNITISAGDMLWLQHSAITTSVNGALGNGGNILIDPQFVILDSSVIQANAVGGNGGNVNIVASEIVPSPDSAITASSQRGLAGDIVITGPLLDLNSSLVVLASTLRSAEALLRDSCAARGDRPRSRLVVASPGGLREEAQTSISALYIANRPMREGRLQNAEPAMPAVPVRLALSTRCG